MASAPSRKGGDFLAVAFGATVAIWALLYIAMPGGHLVMWLLAALGVVVCLFGSGYVLGTLAGRGWRGGAAVGLGISGINLLILASLLGDDGNRMAAISWILGFMVVAVTLGAVGAVVGQRRALSGAGVNWTSRLAWVTVLTTLLMLVAGGIVTGLEAGLAVEGWLIAEGHPLVLFPVSLMLRDNATFVEHAHRLWGLLVGLTTIVLAVHLWSVDRRRWLKWLAVGVVLAVTVQGVVGGTRVTEESVALAIAHGLFAQIIFATMVAIAIMTSKAWTSDMAPTPAASARTDQSIGLILVAAILLQIILGTFFRHLQPVPDAPRGAIMGLLNGHSFVGSVLVIVLVIFCGMRAWGLSAAHGPIRKAGKTLMYTMILQVLLGIGSFVVVPKGARDPQDSISAVEVILTTAHQATGATLLAAAVGLVIWQRRLTVLSAP